MKKLLAILLTAAVLCTTLLALTVSAKPTNAEWDVEFTNKAPNIDGSVDSGEYGNYPLFSFDVKDYSDDFLMDHYKITDDNLSFDFYAAWDADNFYMAWVVHTSYDYRVPDEVVNTQGIAYMWQYCCVQFIITPGAPNAAEKKYQKDTWSGDYLEVGLTLRDDGESYKVCWSQPEVANNGLQLSDWEFAGSRDDKKQITTYEVRLPFEKSGIATKGDEAQFGLTFAVAAQEHYDKTPGMVEWQDGILGGKNADAAAIMTMVGSGMQKQEVNYDAVGLPEGKLPSGLKSSILTFNSVNMPIEAERSTLITKVANPIAGFNTNWSYCMLLRPAEKIKDIDGYYTIVDTYPGDGTMPELSFGTEMKTGDVVAVFHSDGEGTGTERKELAKTLPIGQKLYLFGFETVNGSESSVKYSNAQLCIIEDPAAPLYGTTWIVGEGDAQETVVFSSKEEMTVTINGETKPFTMSDKGQLKIDGKKTTWEIAEDGSLILDKKTYTKVGEAETEQIESLIANAEALKEADYTPETFAALKEALAAAKAKLEGELDARDQDAIDELSAALENAVKALEKIPEESSEEPTPDESSEAAPEESKPEEEASQPATSEEPPAQQPSGFPWWAWLVIGIGAVAIICVIVAIILKSKKK